ncbi:MAG TPA: hypothetical protein VNL70_00815, partial [Tepidisphaeraceae bacterium]|nr:hypothetical protein [Tepidisphaeraceae bacterium]
MLRPLLRRRLLLAGASLFVCSVAPQTSAASINHWINPLGGSWSDPANWRQGRVPLADDRCLFDLDASYTVQLTHNTLVADSEFMRGEVTLDLSGQTFTLESELADRLLVGAAAGQYARLTVSGGGTLFTPLHFSAAQDAAARAVTLGFARVGTGAGSFGRLELNGANTAMPLTGGITLGRPDGSGSGELLIRAGAVVSDTIAGGGLAARIELNPGSSVSVSGTNSRLIVRDFFSTGGALPAAARTGTDASTISITAGASAKAAVWSLGPHTVLSVSDGGRLFNEDGLAAPDLRIGSNAAATLRGLVNIGS